MSCHVLFLTLQAYYIYNRATVSCLGQLAIEVISTEAVNHSVEDKCLRILSCYEWNLFLQANRKAEYKWSARDAVAQLVKVPYYKPGNPGLSATLSRPFPFSLFHLSISHILFKFRQKSLTNKLGKQIVCQVNVYSGHFEQDIFVFIVVIWNWWCHKWLRRWVVGWET